MRILDLGTGSGDIPRLIVDYARSVGAMVAVDAVDQQPSTLEIARSLSRDYPEIEFIEGDVLSFGESGGLPVRFFLPGLPPFWEGAAGEVVGACPGLFCP